MQIYDFYLKVQKLLPEKMEAAKESDFSDKEKWEKSGSLAKLCVRFKQKAEKTTLQAKR